MMNKASRYCLLFVLRYSLGFLAVALLMLYIAMMMTASAGVDVRDVLRGVGAGTILLKWLVSAVPIAIISYIIGSQTPGTTGRLISRLVINIYLAGLMIFFGSHPDYLFGDLIVNDSTTITSMYIEMDALPIALLLMIIPLCSAMDALVEYQKESTGTTVE